MTVIEFVAAMRKLKAFGDTISIPSFSDGGWHGVWELGKVSFGLAKARTIPCRFYGGPPDQHGIYTGTLITVLIDRILTATYGDGCDFNLTLPNIEV